MPKTTEQQKMTLLLTVAYVLRAQTKENLWYQTRATRLQRADDLHMLNEALSPFDGVESTPVDEEPNR